MSTRDPILSALAEKLREDDLLAPLADDRWDALVEGRLGPEETEALRASVERGEAPAVAFEALRPLDEGERESIVDAMFAARANAGPSVAPEAAPDGPIPIERARRSRVRSLSRVVTGLAVAAGLAIILGPMVATRIFPVEPLPAYELLSEGGERPLRDPRQPAVAGPIMLGPDARLRLVVRPESAVTGALEAGVFTRANGVVSRSAVAARTMPNGSFLVEAGRGELFPDLANGEAEVLVVIARSGRMPDAAALDRLLARVESGAGFDASVRVLVQRVTLASR